MREKNRRALLTKGAAQADIFLAYGQEELFLNMQLRKMNRAMSGTKRRETKYEYGALLLLLVILFSSDYILGPQRSAAHNNSNGGEQLTKSATVIALTLQQVIGIALWIFAAFVVTTVFKESHFVALLYWMVVYLPLIYGVGYAVIRDQIFDINYKATAFVVSEILVFLLFVLIYYIYPQLVNSTWFRRKGRACVYFQVKLVSDNDWTMTYLPNFFACMGSRHTCKYDGTTNDKGQPHGLGRWFDDANEGDILVGAWDNGKPVAPFVSRIFGTGDALRAVLVPFVKATDDNFESNKFWPTNDQPMECGVASVECSVSGAFYNELPHASCYIAPYPFDYKTSIKEMYNTLAYSLGVQKDKIMQQIAITADDPRGIQIDGHVYATTGRGIQQVDEIVVRIKTNDDEDCHFTTSMIPPTLINPQMNDRRNSFFGLEKLFGDETSATTSITPPTEQSDNIAPFATTEHNDDQVDEINVEEACTATTNAAAATATSLPPYSLEVVGWTQSKNRDVLIFFGGFNSHLKNSIQNFGQLLAMTKLDSRIYPIMYNWPPGQVLTYHSASRASNSQRNIDNLCQLLHGLQYAGFRNIHLMSHSMGVQTLLGALVDTKVITEDGSLSLNRSNCSRCFALASDYNKQGNDNATAAAVNDEDGGGQGNLLICKTITLLNPDFPLVPFRDHAFPAARRLCRTITVIGDKKDDALFWSQVVNGVVVRYGYEQPFALLPNDECKTALQHCLTVGRNIEKLHFPKKSDVASTERGLRHNNDYNDGDNNLLFKKEKTSSFLTDDDDDDENNRTNDKLLWMDLDAIDTTGLDTNIAGIRHSAFNLNPSLFRDIDELITTGKRAIDRSLIYRDGNVFSYCSAPSFVNM